MDLLLDIYLVMTTAGKMEIELVCLRGGCLGTYLVQMWVKKKESRSAGKLERGLVVSTVDLTDAEKVD